MKMTTLLVMQAFEIKSIKNIRYTSNCVLITCQKQNGDNCDFLYENTNPVAQDLVADFQAEKLSNAFSKLNLAKEVEIDFSRLRLN